MRVRQYKTHYTHSPGQYLESPVDGEAQYEIHILYSTTTHKHKGDSQKFQQAILTLTTLIFFILFEQER